MNTQDQLTLLCFMLGFVTGSACVTIVSVLINAHRASQLKMQGQHLIDKLAAKKQVDFWFTESTRLFVMAVDAQGRGDLDMLNKISGQHKVAVRRFYDAKLNYLEQL